MNAFIFQATLQRFYRGATAAVASAALRGDGAVFGECGAIIGIGILRLVAGVMDETAAELVMLTDIQEIYLYTVQQVISVYP